MTNELRSELPDGTVLRTRASLTHGGTVFKAIEENGQVTLGFVPHLHGAE